MPHRLLSRIFLIFSSALSWLLIILAAVNAEVVEEVKSTRSVVEHSEPPLRNSSAFRIINTQSKTGISEKDKQQKRPFWLLLTQSEPLPNPLPEVDDFEDKGGLRINVTGTRSPRQNTTELGKLNANEISTTLDDHDCACLR